MLNTITDASAGNNVLTPEQRTYYSLELLDRLQNDVVFGQFGMHEDIPANNGQKIQKRRFEKLTFEQTPTPITEGVAPDADSVVITKVEITPNQYGAWIKFTDKALLQSIVNLTVEFLKLIKEKASDTNECVVRNPLLTGTQVLYAGGGRRRGWRCLFLASWLNPQSCDDVIRCLTRTTLAGYRPPATNMVKGESVLLIKLNNPWRC